MTLQLQDIFEVNDTLNRYFRTLDKRLFESENFVNLFLPEGKVARPNGTELIGPEQIAKSHAKSFARFKATQHFVGGHDVTITANKAVVQANLMAVHLWQDQPGVNEKNMLGNHFTAGTIITAELKRTENGWRISQLSNTAVWRDGVGLENMANTDKLNSNE